MSTLSLRLPDSLHHAAREEAKKDHVSINQLISTALAEKIAALKTVDCLSERAKRAPSRSEFERLMSRVTDVKPESRDRF